MARFLCRGDKKLGQLPGDLLKKLWAKSNLQRSIKLVRADALLALVTCSPVEDGLL